MPITIFIPISLLLFAGALLLGIMLYYGNRLAVKRGIKLRYMLIAVAVIFVLMIVPIYNKLADYISYLLSYLNGGANSPLFLTVQEFVATPASDLTAYFGQGFGTPYIYWAIIGGYIIVSLLAIVKYNKETKKIYLNNDMFILLWLPAILSIFYIGIFGKSKYISDAGLMLVIAFGIIFGELLKRFDKEVLA